MTSIKDYIIRRIAGMKAAKRARRDAEIRARFSIAERNGKIYILCLGTAVAVASNATVAKAIADCVEDARSAALEYDSM